MNVAGTWKSATFVWVNIGGVWKRVWSRDGSWIAKGNMPVALHNYAIAAPGNGKLYVVGGYNSSVVKAHREYDPVTDTWTSKAYHTSLVGIGMAAASLGNGKFYVCGGGNTKGESNQLFEYDPAINTWTAKATMLGGARSNHTAAAVGNKLYVFGGVSSAGSIESICTAYDPTTNTWESKASMPRNRRNAAATPGNGKVYVTGGYPAGPYCDEYDPSTNTWTTRASMSVYRAWHAAAAPGNGKLYVFGGRTSATGSPTARIEEYDPAANTWTPRASMPSAREGIGAAVVGGKVYVPGGLNASNVTLSDTLEYTPPG